MNFSFATGLYVFARASLFRNCYELQKVFGILLERPMKLHTAPWERFPTDRLWGTVPSDPPVEIEVSQIILGKHVREINFYNLYYGHLGLLNN